jgi:hypothetical protein
MEPQAEDRPQAPTRRQIAERIVPNFCVTWVAATVFGRGLDWIEARELLRTINLNSALRAMALLNAASVEFSRLPDIKNPDGKRKIECLIQLLFPMQVRAKARKLFFDANRFQPLAPQACIAMTECCLRFCDRIGGTRFDLPRDSSAFSHVLLSFQGNLLRPDLILPSTDFGALDEEQFRCLTKNYMSANYESDLMMLLIRHHMMFEACVRDGVLFRKTGKDGSAWFEAAAGLDPVSDRIVLRKTPWFHLNNFPHLASEQASDRPLDRR